MRKLLLLFYSFLPFQLAAQWQVVPNAPHTSRFDDVTFINDHKGWMAQGIDLYQTLDGGLSWNKISTLNNNSNPYIRSIEFLNDSVGFYGTLATLQSSASLYRTTNGGYTWTAINGIPVNALDGICGIAHWGNLVIAVGTYSSNVPYIYKSTNAGLTWTNINLSSIGKGLVDCHVFDNTNYIVSGISSDNKAFIARTSDAGLTWTKVAEYPTPGFTYVWKMFFLPGGTGFASVEGHPIIYKTTDYGYNWTEINIGFSTAIELGAIGALNDSVIWVGNQYSDGMFGTQDGGQTWTAYPNFGENMDRMAMTDANHLICVGHTVYRFTGDSIIVPFDSSTVSPHHQVTVRPNPADEELTIKMNLYRSTVVLLDLFDEYGNEVKHFLRDTLPFGVTFQTYPISDLQSGTYFLWFRSNEEHKSIKVVVH